MDRNIKKLLGKLETAAANYKADEVERISKALVLQIRDSIVTSPEAFINELRQAADSFDRERASVLCGFLVSHLRAREKPYPLKEAKTLLSILRRKRYFDLIVLVADALLQTGQCHPNIRRQYAQALVDQGHLVASLDMLQILEQDCVKEKNSGELAEARGLMGRVRKQMYVDATRENLPGSIASEHLRKAVQHYLKVYRKAPENVWHGINLAALLDRAKRDKLSMPKGLPAVKTIANNILRHITSKKKIDFWSFASAGEACLALQDYEQALEWYLKYTRDTGDADAFEYASTLRQLEEVWQLTDAHAEQAKILNLVRAALLKQEGGHVEIKDPVKYLASAKELESNKQFERVLGDDHFKTHVWMRKGIERASGVAKFRSRSDGKGVGSGFLIRGEDIHPSFGSDWVVVTNAHVVSNDPAEQKSLPGALAADEVVVCFEGLGSNHEYEVDRILFSSPSTELDCTILKLTEPVDLETPYPIAKRLPLLDKGQRVYIIGYPGGNDLSYSMDDNLLLDYDRPIVHYRAPTEGGSSGSPVFNEKWELLALHHAGGTAMKRLKGKAGTYPANEGLFIQSIREAVAAEID